MLSPLLTSWFGVTNFSEARVAPWQSQEVLAEVERRQAVSAVESPPEQTPPAEVPDADGITACVKIKLNPTPEQRRLLDNMFSTNRAIYNKIVARSRALCTQRRDPRTGGFKAASVGKIRQQMEPIAQSGTLHQFFRRKGAAARHISVNDDVRSSALKDFVKGWKVAVKNYYTLRDEGKKTTFPVMKFRSLWARSNSISIRARDISVINSASISKVHFHAMYFGFKRTDSASTDGIPVVGSIPPIEHGVRLQRLREGDFYLCILQSKQFEPSGATRVCAIDPGVRNFATVYDPEGRTLSVKDVRGKIKRCFDFIDHTKSILSRMDNVCRARHNKRVRTRVKVRTKSVRTRTPEHRKRYRLRRQIRYANRKVTRRIADMHQKVASWLADNYAAVLLPTFQTADMVKRYEADEAADGRPVEAGHEIVTRRGRKRVIRPSTARAMLAQAHFRFRMLLNYKMQRVGGKVIECGEEYTTKTCSSCGHVKDNIGGNHVYRCQHCHDDLDRDVNAAKNILIKNAEKLF